MLAYGEAADLAERALELWPRVPDAERSPGVDHVDLLGSRPARTTIAATAPRAEMLLREALRELDPAADPRRYASLLARLARTSGSLNRRVEALDDRRARAGHAA